MIARPVQLSLLLLATLTAVLRAAPTIPPATSDPKNVLPPSLLPGTGKAPAVSSASTPPASVEPEKKTSVPAAPTSATKVPAAGATPPPTPTNEPAASDLTASAPAASSTPALKPGILSAVKAKGPPPVGKAPAAPAPLSPRFQQVRMKMSALFDTRNSPPAPTDPLTNPFRPAGALPIAPLPTVEGAAPLPAVAVKTDTALLQQAVATMRIKGNFQRGKTLQLVITSAGKEGTYKEGDVINVLLPPGEPVHVRVRKIAAHSVTLSLGDAETVLKF